MHCNCQAHSSNSLFPAGMRASVLPMVLLDLPAEPPELQGTLLQTACQWQMMASTHVNYPSVLLQLRGLLLQDQLTPCIKHVVSSKLTCATHPALEGVAKLINICDTDVESLGTIYA